MRHIKKSNLKEAAHSFAVLVKVQHPDGKNTIRFCSYQTNLTCNNEEFAALPFMSVISEQKKRIKLPRGGKHKTTTVTKPTTIRVPFPTMLIPFGIMPDDQFVAQINVIELKSQQLLFKRWRKAVTEFTREWI